MPSISSAGSNAIMAWRAATCWSCRDFSGSHEGSHKADKAAFRTVLLKTRDLDPPTWLRLVCPSGSRSSGLPMATAFGAGSAAPCSVRFSLMFSPPDRPRLAGGRGRTSARLPAYHVHPVAEGPPGATGGAVVDERTVLATDEARPLWVGSAGGGWGMRHRTHCISRARSQVSFRKRPSAGWLNLREHRFQ